MMMNRLANCRNQYQGKFKRVLCVCSAGLLRSPTAALVLSQPPFNFNTRAAGLTKEYALIYADDVLLEWADEIVCMETEQTIELGKRAPEKLIVCLGIPDQYPYRHPDLMTMIADQYSALQDSSNLVDEPTPSA